MIYSNYWVSPAACSFVVVFAVGNDFYKKDDWVIINTAPD